VQMHGPNFVASEQMLGRHSPATEQMLGKHVVASEQMLGRNKGERKSGKRGLSGNLRCQKSAFGANRKPRKDKVVPPGRRRGSTR